MRGQSQGKSQKLACCKEHADKGQEGELWRANGKGKVRNSLAVKSMVTKGKEVSYEGLIMKEKSETHLL